MFESEYINDEPYSPLDDKITKIIEEYEIDGGGRGMVIGVCNMNNKVYRVIDASGMGAYLHITSSLEKLGLKIGKFKNTSGMHGLDDIFIIPNKIKNTLRKYEIINTPTVFDDITDQEESIKELTETERESVIQSRIGQGKFRQVLIEYWKGCAVTDCDFMPILKASHIKPWRDANNTERLDLFNGLLLSPNLDAAFDSGYISFDNKGKIIQSETFDKLAAYTLRITPKIKLKARLLSELHIPYLEYHQENVLRKF